MNKALRFLPFHLLIAAALLAPTLAPAQITTITTAPGVAPSLEVTRLAPQLVAFAGSQANFDSLVNGLALGTPVTLVSALPTGQIQTVTFTPQGTMTALQIAQTLETARQSLISRGLGTPSGQQVAISLTGGALPTQTGNVQVTGLLPAANQPGTVQPAAAAGAMGPASAAVNPVTTTTSPAVGTLSPSALIQGQTVGGTTPPSPAQIIQNQRGSNISDTPTIGNISNTPSATTNSTLTGNVTGTAPTGTAATGSTAGTTAAPAPTAPAAAVGSAPAAAVGAAPAAASAR